MQPKQQSLADVLDINGIVGILEGTLKDSLEGILEGAADDLDDFVKDITADMIVSIQGGHTKLTEELKGQLKVTAEIQRVRISAEKWKTFSTILDVVQRAASGFLSYGITAVSGLKL